MDQVLIFVLVAIFAYLLGSIPTGLWITRFLGINIREIGSGNYGKANVERAVTKIYSPEAGKFYGYLTMLIDIFKGFLPVYLAINVCKFDPIYIFYISICVMYGNLLPVFAGFDGGKGASHAAGILLAIDWRIAIIAYVVREIAVKITNFSSVGTLLASITGCVTMYLFGYNQIYLLLSFVLMIIIFISHKPNLIRLLKGVELPAKEKKIKS